MGTVEINYDKCDSCEDCINTCPVSVFAKQGEKVVVVNQEACIVCRACESGCTKEAITVTE